MTAATMIPQKNNRNRTVEPSMTQGRSVVVVVVIAAVVVAGHSLTDHWHCRAQASPGEPERRNPKNASPYTARANMDSASIMLF